MNQLSRKFRVNYEPQMKVVANIVGESLTRQAHKDECDVNNILKRFEQTGQLPGLIDRQPQYGEFADVVDYQESLNIVIKAQAQFEALPSHVRERFGNDPALFLEFATDEANGKAMVELGLAKARPEEPPKTPQEVVVVEDKRPPKKAAKEPTE